VCVIFPSVWVIFSSVWIRRQRRWRQRRRGGGGGGGGVYGGGGGGWIMRARCNLWRGSDCRCPAGVACFCWASKICKHGTRPKRFFIEMSLRLLHEKRRKVMKLRIKRCKARCEVTSGMLQHSSLSVWYHIWKLVEAIASDVLFMAFVGVPRHCFMRILRQFHRLYHPMPADGPNY
jgi:hypothetical protein